MPLKMLFKMLALCFVIVWSPGCGGIQAEDILKQISTTISASACIGGSASYSDGELSAEARASACVKAEALGFESPEFCLEFEAETEDSGEQ